MSQQYEVTFTAKDANGKSTQYLTNVTERVPASCAAAAASVIRSRYGANTVVYQTKPVR